MDFSIFFGSLLSFADFIHGGHLWGNEIISLQIKLAKQISCVDFFLPEQENVTCNKQKAGVIDRMRHLSEVTPNCTR